MRHTITFLVIGLGLGTCVEVTHQQSPIKRGEIQPVHSGFFKVFFNRSLNAFFLLANIRARGDIECALVCLKIKVCLSFNFAIVPDANQYTCQLLATDKYRDPHRFALSDQFHHYAMPVLNPCLTDPCSHNFTCQVEFRDQGYRCLSACNTSMGMETGKILDGQISASSQWDAYHAPHQARLNFQERVSNPRESGSWSARINNQRQWLQVDLLCEESVVTSVATQGRNSHPYWASAQWVKYYKLQYSNNGVNFKYYKDERQSTTKVFAGNNDRDSIVRHYLNPPIKARYIRFRPTDWNNHISMRVELYGC